MVEFDCDIVAMTETWLPCEDILANHILNRRRLSKRLLKLHHTLSNTGHRGGGVALIYKSSLGVRVSTINDLIVKCGLFEHSQYLLKGGSKWIRIINVHRPPPSSTSGLTTPKLFSEFVNFLKHLLSLPGQILIPGDVNFHLHDTSNGHTQRDFLEMLDVLSLEQLINEPTHRLGHTLDCVISEQNANLISNIQGHPPVISDHCFITFRLSA